jgi:hypothetical protein
MQSSPQVYAAFDASVLAGRAPDESTLRQLMNSPQVPEHPVKKAALHLLGFGKVTARSAKKTYGLLSYSFLVTSPVVVERNAARPTPQPKPLPVAPKPVAKIKTYDHGARAKLSHALRRTRNALLRGEVNLDLDDVIDYLRYAFEVPETRLYRPTVVDDNGNDVEKGEARTTYGSRFVEEI